LYPHELCFFCCTKKVFGSHDLNVPIRRKSLKSRKVAAEEVHVVCHKITNNHACEGISLHESPQPLKLAIRHSIIMVKLNCHVYYSRRQAIVRLDNPVIRCSKLLMSNCV